MLFRSVRLQTQNDNLDTPREDIAVSVVVQEKGLSIQEQSGLTRWIDFDQVLLIQQGVYRLEIQLLNNGFFFFSQLGHDFDAFVFQVYSAWNVFVSDAMFIDEPCLIEVKGDYDYDTPTLPLLNQPPRHWLDQHGDTRFRLYDSSLMVLPTRGPILRIPLCFVQNIQRDGWQILIQTDQGEQLRLIRLGYETETMLNALNQAIQRQTARALALLRQVLDMLDPEVDNQKGFAGSKQFSEQGLQTAAWHLREGRAVDFPVLNQVCPGLADWLDRLLRQWSKDGYYQSLLKLAFDSGAGSFTIGIRREQWSDTVRGEPEESQNISEQTDERQSTEKQTEDQPEIPAFWLAFPVLGKRPASIVEIISSQPLAQATYVFDRTSDRTVWPLHLQLLTQGLEALDFRRQPIYLPMEKLYQPEFKRDLSALRFCPPLLYLRKSFLGRVIHRDPANWLNALNRLL